MKACLLALVLALALTVSTAAAQCELPMTFVNTAVVTENDLKVTFASDKTNYDPGATVEFCLIVENVGTSQVYINWGIDPQDAIFVRTPDCLSIIPECYDVWPFTHPYFIYFFSAGTTLDPGECRVWKRSWDMTLYPAASGGYEVIGGLFAKTTAGTIGEFRVPTTGVELNIEVNASVPVSESTWGKVKALYR